MTPLLALQSHYLTGRLRLKSSSKCLLIDFDTPLSTREDSSLLLFSSLKFPMPVRPPNASYFYWYFEFAELEKSQ